jgi:anti-sigma B factor antagonist
VHAPSKPVLLRTIPPGGADLPGSDGAPDDEFRLFVFGPVNGCAILAVTGEVDIATEPMLRERLGELAATCPAQVIVDLSRVTFFSAAGLGVLVGGRAKLSRTGGSLALVITRPRLLRIFEITRLAGEFTIRPSLGRCMAADRQWAQVAQSVDEWYRRHGLS